MASYPGAAVFPDNILDLLWLLQLDRVEVCSPSGLLDTALTPFIRTNRHREELVLLTNPYTFRINYIFFSSLQPTRALSEAHHTPSGAQPSTAASGPYRNEAIHGTGQTKLE